MALIPLEQAQAHVLDACAALDAVSSPLGGALGAVAAQDCIATEPVPPFANTAMDGFAVRAADTAGASPSSPVRLRIVGTLRAGTAPHVAVGEGEAVRIMTGAPVPAGADAIVMVERTAVLELEPSGGEPTVEVLEEVLVGTHIRPAGDDLEVGDVVFRAGSVLYPGHLGLLASVGAAEVLVVRRPRVGVMSTGDELVGGGGALQPGQIRDSNRLTLLALVQEAGFEAVDLGLIRDDEAAIVTAIEHGVAECDALITSGGVSMGDFDLVKVVLDRLGDMRWMQVAIKPAKPLAFGTVDAPAADGGSRGASRRVPVFGLPGNPVSSMVSFELFARQGLRKMAGHPDGRLERPRVRAIVDETLRRRPDGKTHFDRVVCSVGADGLYHVRSAGGQGSHQLGTMASADALAILRDGPSLEPGDTVDIWLLH